MSFRIINTAETHLGPNGVPYIHDAARPFRRPQCTGVGMNIQVSQNYIGEYEAIDADTYDCDCDQDGFFCIDVIGSGRTPLDAIVDLLDQKEQ